MDRWGQFNEIIRSDNLTTTEKTLLLLIFSYHNPEKGYSYPSISKLMKETPISDKTTFFKNRNSLVEKGFLTIETIKGRGCKYFISIPSMVTQPSMETKPSMDSIPPHGMETKPTPSMETKPQKEKEKKKEKKNIYIENQNSVSVTYMDLKFIDSLISEVKITEEEYKLLTERYSKKLVHDKIKALDGYKDLDKFGSHVKVLNSWCDKDKDKEEYKDQPQKKRPKKDPYASVKGDYDYLKPKDPPAWVVDWT